MLQRFRENLALLLAALLPLHAFAVTVLTKVLKGSGESPLAMIAIWKEALLLLILVIAVIEIGRRIVKSGQWAVVSAVDLIDISILIALVYSVLIHPWSADSAMTSYIYGFRYDFVPLITFLILRRVEWSEYFLRSAPKMLVIVGAIVAGYGLLSLVLPERWFSFLGYSSMHSLYFPDGPIAAFQYISESGIRRIQSTFSGPNQMGLWLLVPLSLMLGKKKIREVVSDKWLVVSIAFILIAIVLSFSRASWIGALVIGLVFFAPKIQLRFLTLSALALIVLGVTAATLFPAVIVRSISSSAHITRPLAALHTIAEHPFGKGLGSAGPASNRTSDPCVYLPLGADIAWTETVEKLCVFMDGKQFHPSDRTCNCPVLSENWYLQWGVELGLLGLFISLLMPFFVLRKLIMNNEQLIMTNAWRSVAAAFLGISIAALFLHAFEDSAISYTLWILLSATLPLWKVSVAQSSSSTSADSTRT
ncbi:MAG: hypothetical protein ABL890_01550 [Candidatus Peribacteraceae bacterium]